MLRMFALQATFKAEFLAALNAGNKIPINSAMMLMTTNNSINVNADVRLFMVMIPSTPGAMMLSE